MKLATSVMIQATGSHAGKSLFVAGLARLLQRKGLAVAPFKPQNMSNNAAIASDGGEIARAQALQCIACGCSSSSDMNPVLLKPQADGSSQLILQGRASGTRIFATDYPRMRSRLLDLVQQSYRRLAQRYDVIIVEGAGSASEVNLRAADIANMGFALAEKIPVFLLADIERGGSIAAICGTHQLLSQDERALVQGYIINKFRGDTSLFKGALEVINAHTAWNSLGIVPWCSRLDELPAEDSLGARRSNAKKHKQKQKHSVCRVVVLRYPYLSNADDIDPLLLDDNFDVKFLERGEVLPAECDIVLLLGSKSVLADLAFIREQGWHIDLLAHRRRGGMIFGICGGYQMLGSSVEDADGLEGLAGTSKGLGLLDIRTSISEGKTLARTTGYARIGNSRVEVAGYEMHNGSTVPTSDTSTVKPKIKPKIKSKIIPKIKSWLVMRTANTTAPTREDINNSAVSDDGAVFGCYLHGIFTSTDFRRALHQHAQCEHALAISDADWRVGRGGYGQRIDEVLDIWASHLEQHCNVEAIFDSLAKGSHSKSTNPTSNSSSHANASAEVGLANNY